MVSQPCINLSNNFCRVICNYTNAKFTLMLGMLVKNCRRWHFKHFSYFAQKIGFDISCRLSPICMKYQSLFSGQNKNKRAKMALYRSPDYQTSFESIGLLLQMKKFNIDFQDGSHLGFPNRMTLATSDLQVTSILPFESIGLLVQDKKVQNRFWTWLLGWPSWSDQNDFSYFWSTSHSDTSYQVSSQLAFLS